MNNHFLPTSQIKLSATARLIYQLGEQLIEDEFVALLELIKNAYDADAKAVRIEVDTKIETEYGKGKITILDNGNGMLPSIIQTAFLKISTGYKKDNKYSPYFKRQVLGEKGLGRLSIQRLGHYVTVSTSPRIDRIHHLMSPGDLEASNEFNQFNLKLDWTIFQDPTLDLYDIYAETEYIKTDNPFLGTKIEISGIRNLNFWELSKKLKDRINKEIYSMLNPFTQKTVGHSSQNASSNEQNQDNNIFKVNIKIDGENISTDNIDESVIEQVSDVIVDFSFENWKLNVSILFTQKYETKQIEDTVKLAVNKNKYTCINKPKPQNREINYYFDFRQSTWQEDHPKYKNIKFQTVLNSNKEEWAYPGNFEGKIYALNFSTKNAIEEILYSLNENNSFNYERFKSMWDSASGIYIFRNMFRILPYGQSSDWLEFNKIYRMVKRNIFSTQTAAGYVVIDNESSSNLVEQTNRQGFIKDEYGENFFTITRDIIATLITRADVTYREGYELNSKKSEQKSSKINSINKLLTFEKIVTPEENQHNAIVDIDQEIHRTKSYLSHSQQNLSDVLFENTNDTKLVDTIINSNDETIVSLRKAFNDISFQNNRVIDEKFNSLQLKVENLKIIEQQLSNKKQQEEFIVNKKIERLESIVTLAGQSIIVESLTHELNRIEQNIKGYAIQTKNELNTFAKKTKSLNDNEHIRNSLSYQDRILYENSYLKMQLIHLEPTYQSNKLIFEEFSLGDYLKSLYIDQSPMSLKASNQKVKVSIKGDLILYSNKGIITTVFDNLFLNSLYWLDDQYNKEFNIEILETGKIKVWDTGIGIHPEIENQLFEPYKSLKPDGRGLGLFITKQLLETINGSIELDLNNKNHKNRSFCFIIFLTPRKG